MSNQTKEEMVVVTGYKRSGTSLMMALVESLGVGLHYCPQFEAALRSNHGGKNDFYYEDQVLTHCKWSPALHETSTPASSLWKPNKAVKMFSHVVTHNVQQVGHAPDVKVIWVQRDPEKIIRSIRRYKKPGMSYTAPGGKGRPFTLEDDIAIINRLDELHAEAVREIPPHNLLTVHFDDLLQNPVGTAKIVAAFLNKPFDVRRVAEKFGNVINPEKAAAAAAEASGNAAFAATPTPPPALSVVAL